MPSAMRDIIAILLLFFAGQSISAQQEIILDHVTNSIGDTALVAGNTHILNFRYRNFPRGFCRDRGLNIQNGFVLNSADGARWGRTLGVIAKELRDVLVFSQFGVLHQEDTTSDSFVEQGDGISPDFVYLWTFHLFEDEHGLPEGYDDMAFQVEISSSLSDTGLHICIDSSKIGGRPSGWVWLAPAKAECNVVPDWGGPYCFTIVPPECGADFNADDEVNETDLTFLIQYYFSFGPPPTPGTGDVNGDGTIDITDIIYLANYLNNNGPAPCAGTGPGGFDWKDKPDSRQAGND